MVIHQIAFYSGLASALLLTVLMALSFYKRNFHFWPPGSKNWKWLTYWTLSTVNMLSITVLLLPELKTLSLTLNYIFSILLILSGLIISLIAIKQLGLEKTSGVKGEFMEEGLYRFSRNPQVLGNLITLFGVASLLQNVEGTAISFMTGLWLITMVFAEEQWLREKYGEEYMNYRKKTSRFL